MNIANYPFTPWAVGNGHVIVIETGSPKVYLDLLQGAKGLNDQFVVSDDTFKVIETTKALGWYGDPVTDIKVNELFQKKLQATLIQLMSDQQKIALSDQYRQLLTQIVDASFLMDAPLEVDQGMTLEKLFKFAGLRLTVPDVTRPYDILETLIKALLEIHDSRIVGLTNVSHYLDVNQMTNLVRLVGDTDLPVVLIEFSSSSQRDLFQDTDYHYIDQDFVEW